jgi:hypothetical protein
MRRFLAATLLASAFLLQATSAAAALKLTTGLRASSATAATAASTAATSAANPETPVPVAPSIVPPSGRRLSSDDVLEIANALPKMRRERAKYRGSYGGAYLKGPGRWQVSYFARGGKEIGQVIISDTSGRVLEQWTGFQVAWTMARGYPGAFGRHVNALYIWLPLCALFMLPFIDWRRPFCLRHLDLLMLLSFSVSLAFFNHGDIYKSVPLTYPPLIYLLVRMLLLARSRRPSPVDLDGDSAAGPAVHGGAGPMGPGSAGPMVPGGAGPMVPESVRSPGGRDPLHLLIPAPWLAVGVVFLLGFRIGLNVTDSNVIDVGYAGVIGAQRIAHGDALYGGYPTDNEHGDTYGPVNYEAYVPFEQIFGWSGTWDDLPAAHAAAIAFDLLAVGLIFLLGLRIRGPTLGVALAYAWVSYPFTLYALESNSNDSLVAVLLLAALLCATSPPARGAFAALAGLTKIAPLALAPLLATHGLRELPTEAGGHSPPASIPVSASKRPRAFALFVLAFVLTAAIVSIPALAHDSLHEIYERTIAYQSDRGSPFSMWGLYGLKGWETAAQIGAVVLALALAVIPRRRGLPALAAAAAAILIALQLGLEHWFYLYIPWFFPLVMIALLGTPTRSRGEDSANVTPTPEQAVSASEPARSSRLAAA